MTIEKRKFPRVKGAFVEYAYKEKEAYQGPAFIKDISAGGLCIFVTELLQATTSIHMKIYLMGHDEPLLARGRIVWQGKLGYLNYHDVGIEFTEISGDNKKRLEEYIRHYLDEKVSG